MKYILDNNIIIGVSYESDGDDYTIVDPDDVNFGVDMIVNGTFIKR